MVQTYCQVTQEEGTVSAHSCVSSACSGDRARRSGSSAAPGLSSGTTLVMLRLSPNSWIRYDSSTSAVVPGRSASARMAGSYCLQRRLERQINAVLCHCAKGHIGEQQRQHVISMLLMGPSVR